MNKDELMKADPAELTPSQRGALVRWSGKAPLGSMPVPERKVFLLKVLDRLCDGERLEDIATEIGVHRVALNKQLLQYTEDEWRSTQVARALSTVDNADEMLDAATDMVSIARAREKQASARWQLERLHKRLFGNQPEQAQGASVAIQINFNVEPDTTI